MTSDAADPTRLPVTNGGARWGAFANTYAGLLRYPLLLIAILAAQSLLGRTYEVRIANLVFILAIAAVGVNVSLGFAGLISMAHAALMAIGAYASVILMVELGLPFPVAFLVSSLLAGTVSGLVGALGTRVRPLYFLLITAGLHQVVLLVIVNESWLTGGAVGYFDVPVPSVGPWDFASDRSVYSLLAIACLASLYFADRLRESKQGRAMVALRLHESAARVSSVNVDGYRIAAMVFSGIYLGAAGSLFAHLIGFLGPESFTLTLMLQLLLMVVVGGIGSNVGAIVGAVALTLTTEQLRGTGGAWVLYYGLAIMAIMVVAPKGLAGLIDTVVDRLRRKAA